MTPPCLERLDKASDEVVRRVLDALCESDHDIRLKTSKCLDAFELHKQYEPHIDGTERRKSSAGNTHDADNPVPEVYICQKCGDGFLEEHNNDKACFHHPGQLLVDEDNDFWAEFDDACLEFIDTQEKRKEYPDVFIWDCCYQTGDAAKGCSHARHEAIATKRRKTAERMASTSESIDLTDD